jgi:deoxyribodipyrimidine photo-lyase
MDGEKVVLYWFRRDLRLPDNRGLHRALISGFKTLPLFIYDTEILSRLNKDDARVTFIFDTLHNLNSRLREAGSTILIKNGAPKEVFAGLLTQYNIQAVYTNIDYEPYAIKRDREVAGLLRSHGIDFFSFHDQLIFEPGTILKSDNLPYTVFTPFRNKWLASLNDSMIRAEPSEALLQNLFRPDGIDSPPSLSQIGFLRSDQAVKAYNISWEIISVYEQGRDFPAQDAATGLGPHLRFGTISIREVFRQTTGISSTFTSELIWREFFMNILSHFPYVEERCFRKEYDQIEWVNNEAHFNLWCRGMTGYPIVDAGMRELSSTGRMHNRVRMITASFLTKHLQCDWRWGEAWFASKLHDFELSSNNGNWQWAAGTGCDAAPYFRIFSPEAQQKRFDPDFEYIKRWVPEYDTPAYTAPIVENKEARAKALKMYKTALRR